MAYFPKKRGARRSVKKTFARENFIPAKEQAEELNEATVKFLDHYIGEAWTDFLNNLGPLRPTNPGEFITESFLLLGVNPYSSYRALLQMYIHSSKNAAKKTPHLSINEGPDPETVGLDPYDQMMRKAGPAPTEKEVYGEPVPGFDSV